MVYCFVDEIKYLLYRLHFIYYVVLKRRLLTSCVVCCVIVTLHIVTLYMVCLTHSIASNKLVSIVLKLFSTFTLWDIVLRWLGNQVVIVR